MANGRIVNCQSSILNSQFALSYPRAESNCYLKFRKPYIGISYLFTYQYFTEFPKNYLATMWQQMQKNGKIAPPLHHKYSDILRIAQTLDYIISRASYISSFLRSNSASVISECSSLSIARMRSSLAIV